MACLPEIPSDFADRELEKTGLLPAPTSDAEPLVQADKSGPQVNYFFIEYLTRYDAGLPFIDFFVWGKAQFFIVWIVCGSGGDWALGRLVMGTKGSVLIGSLSALLLGNCGAWERIGCLIRVIGWVQSLLGAYGFVVGFE